MSHNPYESIPSLPKSGGVATTQQKPMGLTAIPVTCLIFGLLGVLIALAGLAALAFQAFNGGPPTMPTAGAPWMAKYQAEMQEFQKHQFVPNLIVNGCGLIIGVLLVVGAIGVLKMNEWGRSLLRNALLSAGVFVVLRGFYATWIQYRTMKMLTRAMASSGNDAGTFEMGMQVGLIVVIVIGLVWIAALAGFYLWSRSYLNKESVVARFTAN